MTIALDSARFSRSLRSAILWPVGVIFLSAFLLLLLSYELFQVIQSSDHSYEVLEQTRKCESKIIGLQNQVRGYLLTGDSSFVTAFDRKHEEIGAAFSKLRQLVQDNPQQVIRSDDLIQAKNIWFQHAQSTVGQRSGGAVPDTNWTMMGKNLMDGITQKFDNFIAVEEELRQERLRRLRRMKQILLYAGGGLVLLLSLTVGQSVRRHFNRLAGEYHSALQTVEQRHDALARSEGDLEEQKEWFRVTLSSIGDGVIVTDEEGRVVFMNHEAERLTDWTSMEALLQPLPLVFKIIHEETRNAVEDPVAKVFREKKVIGLANHTILVSNRGREWPIEDSAAPICDAGGETQGVVLVFHDATEMRDAQNRLKLHAEELERNVRERTVSLQQTVSELEMFSYTISHDLRSPLRAMQGFSEALMEDYPDKLDERGRNYLARIKNAAQRLDRLIQDLLAYTRISRENAPLVQVDMDRSVRDVVEHYPNLQPSVARIEVASPLPRVWGREAALTQVISNLLGNAVKFVSAGTVPHVKVWSEAHGARVRLWIEDNGIGMASGNLERIFQIFIQINEPALYGGTGVGLAIVKKAVETMQGSFGVESEEGKGSRFWVELNKATP